MLIKRQLLPYSLKIDNIYLYIFLNMDENKYNNEYFHQPYHIPPQSILPVNQLVHGPSPHESPPLGTPYMPQPPFYSPVPTYIPNQSPRPNLAPIPINPYTPPPPIPPFIRVYGPGNYIHIYDSNSELDVNASRISNDLIYNKKSKHKKEKYENFEEKQFYQNENE